MNRTFLSLSGVLGALAVALGAMGTHSIRDKVTPASLAIWETAAHYHLIHAVALLGVAAVCGQIDNKLTRASGWCFVVGILIFGGTLYTLALTGIRWLGAITPLGGVSLIAGWVCLALGARSKAV